MKYTPVVVGDFGMTIRANAGIDVTGYDSVWLRFIKPGGTVVEKEGAVYNTTYVQYVPLSADLICDTAGEVRVVCKLVTGSTILLKSPKCGKIIVVEEGTV